MTEDDLAAAFAGPNQFVVSQAIHDDFVQWLQALYPKVNCLRMCRRQTRQERRAAGPNRLPIRRACWKFDVPELSEAQKEEFSRLLVGYADLLAPRSQTQEEP